MKLSDKSFDETSIINIIKKHNYKKKYQKIQIQISSI